MSPARFESYSRSLTRSFRTPSRLDETACKTLIAMTILVGVFSGLNILYLRHANRAKARRREEKEEANYLVEGDQHPAFLYNY